MGRLIRILRKIKKNPKVIYLYFNPYGLLKFIPDEMWIKMMWKAKTGADIDLENPKGFNEKLQWLKLNNRKPEYTTMVDKYLVRDYVAGKIGQQYLVPLLGVYDDANEIDFDALPNEFVLKCNHNSGEGMCLCKDKKSLNIKKVKENLNKHLKENYYYAGRDWPYKNVSPKILCEKFMVDNDPLNITGVLLDYKFYCFNGNPLFLFVGDNEFIKGRKGGARLSFFDMQWNTPEFYRTDHELLPIKLKKPYNFDEMVHIAKVLSQGIPFVRVDLYNINNQIYFSELTFSPGGGFGLFSPKEWEYKIGEYLVLPEK